MKNFQKRKSDRSRGETERVGTQRTEKPEARNGKRR